MVVANAMRFELTDAVHRLDADLFMFIVLLWLETRRYISAGVYDDQLKGGVRYISQRHVIDDIMIRTVYPIPTEEQGGCM